MFTSVGACTFNCMKYRVILLCVVLYCFFFLIVNEHTQGLYSWSFYIINNDLPKYLNDILHVSIEENSIYSSIPKVLSVLVSTGSGYMCDLMLNKFHYNRTCIRKVFVVLSE